MPPAATTSLLAYPLEMLREGAEVAAALGFSFCSADGLAEDAAVALLHPGEQRRWRDFKYPLRRANYLLGRGAAKIALAAAFPAVQSREIEIEAGVFGQPLVRSAGLAAEVSIAHSCGAAVAVACAVGHPIGVDLEWVDATRADVVCAGMSPGEQALWARTALAPAEAGFVSWSAREALAKVLRCGLTVPFPFLELAEITVTKESISAVFPNFPQYAARSWLAGGYALSIVRPKRTELDFSPPSEVRAGLQAAANLSGERSCSRTAPDSWVRSEVS